MMKLLVGGAIAALAIATAPLVAQTAPPPPAGVAPGTGPIAPVPPVRPVPPVSQIRERTHMMIMSDKTMTRDEVVRHVRELFARFDTDRDGYVTRQELEAFHAKFANMGADMRRRIEEHGIMIGDRAAMFDRLDANHDGVISRHEFTAASPKTHERRVMVIREGNGSGGDGMAAMDGMERMHMRMHGGAGAGGMPMRGTGGFGGHLFEMADTNRDGRVSLQEAEGLALQHFDRADLNHDGRITPDERRQTHELMHRERRPG